MPNITSVSIQSADNIWYTGVGDYTNFFLIKHWDGKHYETPQGLPDIIYQPYDFGEATLALSHNNIWTIGSGPDDKQPLRIYHFDGIQWHIVPGPTLHGEDIHSMAAVNANNIWAVGQNDNLGQKIFDGFNKTFVMHWDGIQWQHITSPSVAGNNNSLSRLSVISSTDIWAAGSVEAPNGGSFPLIEHWNGTKWSISAFPNTGKDLFSLSPIAAITALTQNDAWALGYKGFIFHWDGKQWQVIIKPDQGNTLDGKDLLAIDALNAKDIWAVGVTHEHCNAITEACTDSSLIEHWDGKKWNVVPDTTTEHQNSTLLAVRAFSPNNIVVVGEIHSYLPQTFIEHWNGSTWLVPFQSRIF